MTSKMRFRDIAAPTARLAPRLPTPVAKSLYVIVVPGEMARHWR
jgi:hypothetical protein